MPPKDATSVAELTPLEAWKQRVARRSRQVISEHGGSRDSVIELAAQSGITLPVRVTVSYKTIDTDVEADKRIKAELAANPLIDQTSVRVTSSIA